MQSRNPIEADRLLQWFAIAQSALIRSLHFDREAELLRSPEAQPADRKCVLGLR